jgi:hypothetical protein
MLKFFMVLKKFTIKIKVKNNPYLTSQKNLVHRGKDLNQIKKLAARLKGKQLNKCPIILMWKC